MKTIKKHMIAASCLSMLFAGATQAQSGLYVGINVGDSDLSGINTVSSEQVAGVSRTLDIDTDSDTSVGFKVGYTVLGDQDKNRFSIELYYQDSEHDVENVVFQGNNFDAGLGTAEGSLDIETILIRATYQFELGAIDPYVGIGIGESELDADVRYGGSIGTPSGSQPPFAFGSDSATAIEFRLGAEYSITKQLGVFLEYTYTTVDDITFSRIGGGPGGLATTQHSDDFDVDAINLGLNFKF